MKRKRNYAKKTKQESWRSSLPKLTIPEISLNSLKDNLTYVLFVCFLIVVYIGSTNQSQRKQKALKKLELENSNLKDEFLTTTSELMQTSTQSAVAEKLIPHGINESLVSPLVIQIEDIE